MNRNEHSRPMRRVAMTLTLSASAATVLMAAHRSVTIPGTPALHADGHQSRWHPGTTRPRDDPATSAGHITDVSLSPGGLGLAVSSSGTLWQSLDDGVTWAVAKDSRVFGSAVALRADGLGLIVGGRGHVFRTADFARSWQQEILPDRGPLTRVAFGPANSAVAVGSGVVLTSHDAGATWSVIGMPPFDYHDVALDREVGLIVGGGGRVLRSIDGGMTWTGYFIPEVSNTLRGVAFVSPTDAIAVGSHGLILRSSDAGLTWSRVTSGTTMHLRDVDFDSHGRGLAVGLFGTLLRSADGGRSWRRDYGSTSAHLLAAAVMPDGRALAAGWFDTIIVANSRPSDADQ